MHLDLNEFTKDVIGLASNLIAIFCNRTPPFVISPNAIPPNAIPPSGAKNSSPPTSRGVKQRGKKLSSIKIKTFINQRQVYIPLFFIFAFFTIIFLNIFGDHTIITIESPIPSVTPFPVAIAPPIQNPNDAWLDDLDSILPRKRAFFVHAWDSYNPVEVGNTTYPHCIGVCIPKEAREKYYDKNSPDQQIHSEYIEYSLSNKYQTLQFDYGIDDCSFPDDVEEESLCEFNIVVQSCNSTEFLKDTDNILFDSGWINYRCGVHRVPEIDVSGCEALRITVTWRFYVRQEGPIAFNIAILNPILRVAKFNIKSTAKPDSIY